MLLNYSIKIYRFLVNIKHGISLLADLSSQLELVVLAERLGWHWFRELAEFLVVVRETVEHLQMPRARFIEASELYAEVFERWIARVARQAVTNELLKKNIQDIINFKLLEAQFWTLYLPFLGSPDWKVGVC